MSDDGRAKRLVEAIYRHFKRREDVLYVLDLIYLGAALNSINAVGPQKPELNLATDMRAHYLYVCKKHGIEIGPDDMITDDEIIAQFEAITKPGCWRSA